MFVANTYNEQFPLAANALLNNTYVDDILAGGESIEEVQTLKCGLIELLKLGSFQLHKWCSNKMFVFRRHS